MKSEIYLSAKILDDYSAGVEVHGTWPEVMALLEEVTVVIFKPIKEAGNPEALELMRLFFKNVTERVFPDDLRAHL